MEHKDNYDRLLPMPVKLGFGIANLGDTVITEFVGAFFIFFLTNIAGVPWPVPLSFWELCGMPSATPS